MRCSRVASGAKQGAGAKLGSLLLLAVWGCGHSAASAPMPPNPAPAARGSGAYGGAERRAPAVASSVAPDPSEAITPRELASIPDPVPGNTSTDQNQGTIQRAAAVDSEIGANGAAAGGPSAGGAAAGGSSAALSTAARGQSPQFAVGPDGRRFVWRVQLFASPDLSLAGRIAREASQRFGEPSVIEFEDTLYKVRLGEFATESLAQSLRERAVREGFPGAFRMRCEEPVKN